MSKIKNIGEIVIPYWYGYFHGISLSKALLATNMPRKLVGKIETLVRLYYIRDYKNPGVPNICRKAMPNIAYCNSCIDSLIAKYRNSQAEHFVKLVTISSNQNRFLV